MKRFSVAICVVALGLPAAAQTEDSVLVRAAKAARQNTMKAKVVITNETLVTSGGWFTTTNATPPIPKGVGPVVVSENSVSDARAIAETAARREAAAKRLQRLKDDPAGYLRDVIEPRGQQRVETTMSPVQLPLASTAQVPQSTTSQPRLGTAYQPTTMTPTPIGTGTTVQPEIGTAARPPER